MKSPFPGMDPYLEGPTFWRGTHTWLITGIAADLQPQLIPRYVATLEVDVVLGPMEEDRTPDVFVSDPEPERGGSIAVATRVSTAEATIPEIIRVSDLTVPHRYVCIRDTRTREVITVIELLSPSNKRQPGLRKYREKQEQILLSSSSPVEIDLLRAGQHTVAVPQDRLRPSHYRTCVHRAEGKTFEVIPFGIRDPLPKLAVPLRDDDPDVVLHLDTVFQHSYEGGAYPFLLDYSKPPDPPLSGADAEWADEQIRQWRAAGEPSLPAV